MKSFRKGIVLTTILLACAAAVNAQDVPNKATVSHPPSTKKAVKTPSQQDKKKIAEQIDIVTGEGRKTLALIEDLLRWQEIDPEHPSAQRASDQLRVFLPRYQHDFNQLVQMVALCYGDKASEWPAPLLHDLHPIKQLDEEIDSKKRQLDAMGFTG